MIPYKVSTKDRIIQIAAMVGKRIKHTCLELTKFSCYHEFMKKDLCSTIIGDENYWKRRKTMHGNDSNSKYNGKGKRKGKFINGNNDDRDYNKPSTSSSTDNYLFD